MVDEEPVVLVDESGQTLLQADHSIHTMDKLKAHRLGVLHRAVSVFVFNSNDELLLQKRAAGKYHSPDKWTNTCCTHPFPGEYPRLAAKRRLKEEMGISVQVKEAFTFLYQADVGNGLVEHEYDHVFIGFSDASAVPNAAEVAEWRRIRISQLEREITEDPERFTPWLRLIYQKVFQCIYPSRSFPRNA